MLARSLNRTFHLAAASKATIVGFHTSIESHADDMIKQKKVAVYTQDVIYHLIDEVKEQDALPPR